MNLDAHQHFWRYNPSEYPWIKPGTPLHRDWLPNDLQQTAGEAGIHGSIVVQARQTTEETRWLLQLADETPFVKGVVGWVDLRALRVEEALAEFAAHPAFVGVRHVVQDEADPQFLLGCEFVRGISHLRSSGLAYDLLLYPKHLPAAVRLVRQFPEQTFVLDHMAKPVIRAGLIDPWRSDLRDLARSGNVYCKLSGLITEGNLTAWKPEDIWPYLDAAVEAFGENRIMFGSDWPVCLMAGSYQRVHALVADYMQQFSAEAQQAFFGGTAIEAYQLARKRRISSAVVG